MNLVIAKEKYLISFICYIVIFLLSTGIDVIVLKKYYFQVKDQEQTYSRKFSPVLLGHSVLQLLIK